MINFRNIWFLIVSLLVLDYCISSEAYESKQPDSNTPQQLLNEEQEAPQNARLKQLAAVIRRAEMEGYKNSLLEAAASISRPKKASLSVAARIVKFAGMIFGGIGMVAGGFLAYRYDVYGIGSVIGSYGSWWQGIKNWIGIRRIEQTQTEHSIMLTEHGNKLNKVITAQTEHSSQLNQLALDLVLIKNGQHGHQIKLEETTKGLQELSRGQTGQVETLMRFDKNINDNTVTLLKQNEMLTNVFDEQKKHTSRLDELNDRLDILAKDSGEIKSILADYMNRLEALKSGQIEQSKLLTVLQDSVDGIKRVINDIGITKEEKQFVFSQLDDIQKRLNVIQTVEKEHFEKNDFDMGLLNANVLLILKVLTAVCNSGQGKMVFSEVNLKK